MQAVPPKAAERLMGFLIPPASREEVLGDLHERYRCRRQYIRDVVFTVPLVIASRIRRTVDPLVLLMEAFILYTSFLAAAWYKDRTFLNGQWGLLRLAIPAAIALVVLMLDDAYARPGKPSLLKQIRGPALGVGVALLSQAIPRWIMFCGGGMGLLLVSATRLLFPPVAGRPQGANGPAVWLEHAGEPVNMSSDVIRLLKSVGAIVALLVVYELSKRG